MQTTIRKYGIFFTFFVLSLSACASAPPELFTFPTPTGGIQYYFPMMEWQGDSKDISAAIHAIGATCDITYRHEPGLDGRCNITFTYISEASQGKIPPVPSALTLSGDGVDYTLTNIEMLFSERNQIRITSQIDGDGLFALLKAQSISLTAALDGAEYRFTPPKVFFSYRDEFLADVAARPRQ
jgi:hypothetical protein